MEKKTSTKSVQPSVAPKVEINAAASNVKAAHPSSNPINEIPDYNPRHSYFEVEVHNAFFKIFNI